MTKKDEVQRAIFKIPTSLYAAAVKHCEKRGITLADLYRRAIAKEIGQPKLANDIRPNHRPRKSRDD